MPWQQYPEIIHERVCFSVTYTCITEAILHRQIRLTISGTLTSFLMMVHAQFRFLPPDPLSHKSRLTSLQGFALYETPLPGFSRPSHLIYGCSSPEPRSHGRAAGLGAVDSSSKRVVRLGKIWHNWAGI